MTVKILFAIAIGSGCLFIISGLLYAVLDTVLKYNWARAKIMGGITIGFLILSILSVGATIVCKIFGV